MAVKRFIQMLNSEDTKREINKLLNDIYLGEKTYHKIANKFINTINVFIVSTRKFLIDDCLTKASSIAYTTIISLIPTLTVALTFYSIFSGVGDKKEELFQKITQFMLEHNIKLNIDFIIEAILSLIENAGKIGGVGAIVMIFSATAVLRTLEKSLNNIWRIEAKRSFFLKIIFYWAALTLGPIIFISGTTVATQVSASLSSPNYKSAYISHDNKLWIVGSKSKILYSKNNDISFTYLPLEKIDFDNQKIYKFDRPNNTFTASSFRFDPIEFKNIEFKDIQFIGKQAWIIAKNGIVLISNDSGKIWLLKKFGSFNLNEICMIDSNKGFITADDGYLLSTENGGKNWKVNEWEGITSNLNSISFYNNYGIITGDRGIILKTIDSGLTWENDYVKETRKKNRYISLNCVYHINKEEIVLVGDEGTILFSFNGGKKWINRKFQAWNYHSAYFLTKEKGYIAGDKGIIIYTEDAGETWRRINLPSSTINSLLFNDKILWAIGDAGIIMKSGDEGKTWSGVKRKSFLSFLLNFLAPFGFIWILFLMIYMVLPNTKIPFKPAAIGAAFTSSVWVVFILLFNFYIKFFAKGTLAIYGALAAFPLFLLLIYASTLIILYGAELSYILMHPHLYLDLKNGSKISEKIKIYVYNGISILYQIYKQFEDGKGAVSYNDLLNMNSNIENELEAYLILFKKEGLILETEEDFYIPTNSSKNIILSDLFDVIQNTSLAIPGVSQNDVLKKYLQDIFTKIKNSQNEYLGSISLNDVIKNAV